MAGKSRLVALGSRAYNRVGGNVISRRTTIHLADLYCLVFGDGRHGVKGHELHDWLFEREHGTWLLDRATRFQTQYERTLKEFILGLHTAKSLPADTPPEYTKEQMGQYFLERLTADILVYIDVPARRLTYGPTRCKKTALLLSSLELDGYRYQDGRLYPTEGNVLDEEEEEGLIERHYRSLGLANQNLTFTLLKDSQSKYLIGDWSGCIGDARKFMESVLREVAACHAQTKGATLKKDIYDWAGEVRKYLRDEAKLFSEEETTALAKIYGLMSETGSHPYLPEKDQARLSLNLGLTISQFALLKLQSAQDDKK